MATSDARLRDRAGLELQRSRQGRTIVLGSVAAVVLFNTLIDALAGFHLLTGDLGRYRAWVAISMGLTALINLILLFLVWVLFETLGRVERESDRLQTFMDHTYRRLL